MAAPPYRYSSTGRGSTRSSSTSATATTTTAAAGGQTGRTPRSLPLAQVSPTETAADIPAPAGNTRGTLSTRNRADSGVPSSSTPNTARTQSANKRRKTIATTATTATTAAATKTAATKTAASSSSRRATVKAATTISSDDIDSSDNGEGGEESFTSPTMTSTVSMSMQEQSTEQLERNRLAAQKSRRKRKTLIETLETQAQDAQITNQRLRNTIEDLKQEIVMAKQQLFAHYGCNCTAIHQYIAAKSEALAAEEKQRALAAKAKLVEMTNAIGQDIDVDASMIMSLSNDTSMAAIPTNMVASGQAGLIADSLMDPTASLIGSLSAADAAAVAAFSMHNQSFVQPLSGMIPAQQLMPLSHSHPYPAAVAAAADRSRNSSFVVQSPTMPSVLSMQLSQHQHQQQQQQQRQQIQQAQQAQQQSPHRPKSHTISTTTA
ncbi:hypothetical protein GQ42DRAFT_162183 [Ramicandelaber brevisporus]|nr:hypothetical protein GQ42DRAFT_162183 [Ramicandelaber brevisporus]